MSSDYGKLISGVNIPNYMQPTNFTGYNQRAYNMFGGPQVSSNFTGYSHPTLNTPAVGYGSAPIAPATTFYPKPYLGDNSIVTSLGQKSYNF